ncbi:MAG: threonine aldolase family protein [Pseudomonadota bacterium]
MSRPNALINFYSDTQTQPMRAMLETALTAPVGDEQRGDDPTTNALCERVADLLGQEAAVFLPSGTMCNEIALAVHTAPGDEVICERLSHIVTAEGGGPAAISGLMINMIDGDRGRFTAEQLAAHVRFPSRYEPRSRVVSVENTANYGGGAVWDLAALQGVISAGREAGLAVHMDGARLMNAAVQSGHAAADFAGGCDSVWIDFTKGLGAPVGAVLAGSQAFIDEAWRYKQRFGGAMRQSGVVAAMCNYALDHNVDRLAEDHDLATGIAAELEGMSGIAHVIAPETNIVIFDLAEDAMAANEVIEAMAEHNIRFGALGPRRMRIVTHLDVDEAAAKTLCGALRGCLG